MTVYIAEKPDIATAMAAYLWSDYSSYKHKHCYQKGEVIVTWAYGHIMMTAMPEAYNNYYEYIYRKNQKDYQSNNKKHENIKNINKNENIQNLVDEKLKELKAMNAKKI